MAAASRVLMEEPLLRRAVVVELCVSSWFSVQPPATTQTVDGSRKKDFSYLFVASALFSCCWLEDPAGSDVSDHSQPHLNFRPGFAERRQESFLQ